MNDTEYPQFMITQYQHPLFVQSVTENPHIQRQITQGQPATERKRARKTNPAFSSAAQERAAEIHLQNLAFVAQENKILERRRSAVSNVFVKDLNSYLSLSDFIGCPSNLVFVGESGPPRSTPELALSPDSARISRPFSSRVWNGRLEDLAYLPHSLIIIHRLLRYGESAVRAYYFPEGSKRSKVFVFARLFPGNPFVQVTAKLKEIGTRDPFTNFSEELHESDLTSDWDEQSLSTVTTASEDNLSQEINDEELLDYIQQKEEDSSSQNQIQEAGLLGEGNSFLDWVDLTEEIGVDGGVGSRTSNSNVQIMDHNRTRATSTLHPNLHSHPGLEKHVPTVIPNGGQFHQTHYSHTHQQQPLINHSLVYQTINPRYPFPHPPRVHTPIKIIPTTMSLGGQSPSLRNLTASTLALNNKVRGGAGINPTTSVTKTSTTGAVRYQRPRCGPAITRGHATNQNQIRLCYENGELVSSPTAEPTMQHDLTTNPKTVTPRPRPKRPAPPRRTGVKRGVAKKSNEVVVLSSDEEEAEGSLPKRSTVESGTGLPPLNHPQPESSTNPAASVLPPNPSSTELVPEDMIPKPTAPQAGITRRPVVRLAELTPGAFLGPRPAMTNGNAAVALPGSQGLAHAVTPEETEKESLSSPSPEEVKSIMEEMTTSGFTAGSSTFTTIACNAIRIGTYKSLTNKALGAYPSIPSDIGIMFDIVRPVLGREASKDQIIRVAIPSNEIRHVFANFSATLPVLIIWATHPYGIWLRDQMRMNDPSRPDYYYDTESKDENLKYMILLPEKITALGMAILKRSYGRCLTEINATLANHAIMGRWVQFNEDPIIAQSGHGQNILKTDIESPAGPAADPTPTSAQPGPAEETNRSEADADTAVKTTKQAKNVPPPIPESRFLMKLNNPDNVNGLGFALHSGDVLTLGEEQFLNDQLLDFWLTYFRSTLNEEEKKRTHLFSNYFYRCLITRPKRRSCAPWENDTKLSPAEKRHHRVKKWTRHVDIFSKDFILIPVNDSCHWFLAVICYPALTGFYDLDTGEPLPDMTNMDPPPPKKKRRINKKKDDDEFDRDPDRDEEDGDSDEERQYISDLAPVSSATSAASSQGSGSSEENSEPGPSSAILNKPAVPRVKQPCILIFDSMRSEPRSKVYSTLREYLRVEYKTKKHMDRSFTRKDMPGWAAQVPDQPNFYDCGIYCVQFAENFFLKPLQTFHLPLPSLLDWVPESIVYTKRKEMYEKICQLVESDSPQNAEFLPNLVFNPPPLPPPPQEPKKTTAPPPLVIPGNVSKQVAKKMKARPTKAASAPTTDRTVSVRLVPVDGLVQEMTTTVPVAVPPTETLTPTTSQSQDSEAMDSSE